MPLWQLDLPQPFHACRPHTFSPEDKQALAEQTHGSCSQLCWWWSPPAAAPGLPEHGVGTTRTDPSLTAHSIVLLSPLGGQGRAQVVQNPGDQFHWWVGESHQQPHTVSSAQGSVPLKSPGTSLYTMSWRVLSDLGEKNRKRERNQLV